MKLTVMTTMADNIRFSPPSLRPSALFAARSLLHLTHLRMHLLHIYLLGSYRAVSHTLPFLIPLFRILVGSSSLFATRTPAHTSPSDLVLVLAVDAVLSLSCPVFAVHHPYGKAYK